MLKVLFLLLFATLLCANPKIYSALGDAIYDSVEKIEELKNIVESKEYKDRIDEYVQNLYRAKEIGFALEMGSSNIDKKEYLKRLRELSKINDSFFRYAQSLYKESMKEKNTKLWSRVINSGLIDIKRYRDEILDFYFEHSDEIDREGVIERFLDEDRRLEPKNKKKKSSTHIKKETQEDKIKRIRERDRLKQEAIQKSLEEELLKKKSQIRSKQLEELSKTR